MARLPLIDPATATGDVGEALRGMPVMLNLFRVLANAEGCMTAQLRLGGAILSRQMLGDRDRELLILLVARLQNGRYEWTHHVPIARLIGVSAEAIQALDQLDLAGPFDPRDRALLAFGRQVVERADVEDDVFDQVRVHLTEREIMEAILALGYYMTMARVLNVTRTEMDADETAGLKLFKYSKAPRA